MMEIDDDYDNIPENMRNPNAVIPEKNVSVDLLDLTKPIVERDVIFVDNSISTGMTFNHDGFPAAKTFKLTSSGSSKKQSLYSRSKGLKTELSSSTPAESSTSMSNIIKREGLLGQNTDQEMKRIDQENQEKVRDMSTKEIEETLAMLRKQFSPESLDFLKNRSKKRQIDVGNGDNVDIKDGNPENSHKKAENFTNLQKIQDKIPVSIEELQSGKYPTMIVEKEKLEWLGDLPQGGDKIDASTDVGELQARFDFNGEIINYDKGAEIDVKQGLHHHGEQPDKAGYTIGELLLYVHSSFGPQKQLALKTFASIIMNAYRGAYDAVFNHNIIEYLLKDSSLVLTVRLCLDDPSDTIWKHSLQCFRSFVCNTFEDELFVDRGFLLFEDYLNFGFDIKLFLKPFLEPEVHIDDSISDQQFLMHDMIDCLVERTNILERFSFILKNLVDYKESSDVAFVDIILDVLIRFSRHSRRIAEKIVNSQELMKNILEHHLLKHNTSSHELSACHVKTFKLIRILITTILSDTSEDSDKKFYTLKAFLTQISGMGFVKSLEYCLHINPQDNLTNSSVMLRIAIEGIRCWIKILSTWQRFPKHSIVRELCGIFSTASFMKIFDYCSTLTPKESSVCDINRCFDFQFASCIFVLAKINIDILKAHQNLEPEVRRIFFTKLVDIVQKWLAILDHENCVPDFDSSVAILVLEEFILDNCQPETLQIGKLSGKLFQNEVFVRKMFHFLKTSSNASEFGKNTPGSCRDSENLPSFGSVYFQKFKSISLFNQDSSVCLLLALMRIEEKFPEVVEKSPKTVGHFVDYIQIVGRNVQSNYEPSVFDLIELHIVSRACLSARNHFVTHLQDLKPEVAKILIKFATLVNILNPTEIKAKLIVDILFDAGIWSVFGHTFDSKAFEHFKNVYSKLSPFCDQYWLFHPLLNMIDFKVEKDNSREAIPVAEVLSCLKYIQLFLQCVPEYFHKMQVKTSSFFMLMCSVFFFPDLIFFDEAIEKVLKDVLLFLLEFKGGVVIHKEDTVPHIGNAVDFFERLLAEFEFSSMGNPIFCNYILVFIQQECSTNFKRSFLSNHSTDVERTHLMSITTDQLLIPIERFLSPIETDPEILDIYFRCLGCPSVTPVNSPVLYCLMVHHLHHALFTQQSNFLSTLAEKDPQQKKRFDWLMNSLKRAPAQLRSHLEKYERCDLSMPFGIVLKD